MKKFYHLFVLINLLILFSCSKKQNQSVIATTIHPFQLIISELVGPQYPVHNLMPASASPHTFRLRPSDLSGLEQTQILFTGGKNLDTWAVELPVKNKIDLLSLIPNDFTISFNDDPGTTDPHFWMDPLAVQALLPALTDYLIKYTSLDTNQLKNNTDRFLSDLSKLHAEIVKKTAPYKGNRVILSHPFFNYFLKRYDFRIAGIIEKHPGQHPTPKSVENMIDNLIHNNVKIILTHPAHADDIAGLISESAGIPVCELDPMGMNKQVKTYQDLIRFNTKLLLESLN